MSMADDYISQYDYPPGYIQGGTHGLVIVRNGENYSTAFVEFFPESGGFIRGEGATLQEAEKDVLMKITTQSGCTEHEYNPKHYTNGVGFCKHCGQMKSHAFTAEELGQFCKVCGIPTGVEEGRAVEKGIFVCDEHDEIKPYSDMLSYLNWFYEGNEDIKPETREIFGANLKVLKEICFENGALDPRVLTYFGGIKFSDEERIANEN